MGCTIEVKNQINDLWTMLGPIWTKLNQLHQLINAENDPVNNDSTEPTENVHEIPPVTNENANSSTSSLSQLITDSSYVSNRRGGVKQILSPDQDALSSEKHQQDNKSQSIPLENFDLSNLVATQTVKTDPIPKLVTRSVYLTPFKPEATIQHIMHHLSTNDATRLFTDKIVGCVSLAPSKKKVPNPTFISFKLDVPDELFSVFSDEKVWLGLGGLTAKEFVPKKSQLPVKAPPAPTKPKKQSLPTIPHKTATQPNGSATTNFVYQMVAPQSQNSALPAQTKPKNYNGNKKQPAKRNQSANHQKGKQKLAHKLPMQQQQSENQCSMPCCRLFQAQNLSINGYNSHYVGHQPGNQFRPRN